MAEMISILIILSTVTYVDGVKDFVALVVVNEIDNYFFSYMRSHPIHKLIVSGHI